MDNKIVEHKEFVKALAVLILIVLVFFFVGTLDHQQEIAHEAWLAELEAKGAWVLR